MSRLPPQQQYAPPPGQVYYHQTPTHSQHIGHPPPQLQNAYHPPDPNMYAHDHRSGVNGYADGAYHEPLPGPSRLPDQYAAYSTQPPRSSPIPPPGSAHGRPQLPLPQSNTPLAGWQSAAPSLQHTPMALPRSTSATRTPSQAVKLEDLVDHPQIRPGPGGFTSVPLDTTAGMRAPSVMGGDRQTAAQGQQQQPGPSEFIKKLYKMLEEESQMYGNPEAPRPKGAKRGSVGWGRGGSSFVVWDMNEFTTKVLPQTFRHSNFSSFVRQLNKYGFSKIKHVDEDTGQIRENVWEFQHPSFQAGGKADLDSIKRKVVAPKKGQEPETETSPAAVRIMSGLTMEDAGRIVEMESRVLSLEDGLARAIEEVRKARNRELGLLSVVKELVGQVAQAQTSTNTSPVGSAEPSSMLARLSGMLDQIHQASVSRFASFSTSAPFATPTGQGDMFPGGLHYPAPGSAGRRPLSGSYNAPSPRTDGSGSRPMYQDGPSPAGSKASTKGRRRAGTTNTAPDPSALGMVAPAPEATEDVIELADASQTLYNGEPMSMTPLFAETPAWLTEATNVPLNIYHRKSSDGAALRLMVDALSTQGPGTAGVDSTVDPLDTAGAAMPPPAVPQTTIDPSSATLTTQLPQASGTAATVQQSPFGTLVVPPQAETQDTNANPVRLRRSTTIRPHWTHAPRILVVEDDMVYRQLSSKFLDKFGCQTETVENAQGAVEKMNSTKYDLVLMDIFFGPHMDGRKATSLIRQFDIYTPIISMTSNVQTHDVNSYLQSGMNDVLAKPFTKHGLFGILDKHLIHLKAIQLSAEVPRSLGLPPLSDQGVVDAVMTGAAEWVAPQGGDVVALRNPLSAMGWSDETYHVVIGQFMQTGTMPDLTAIQNGAIGTSVVFGDSSGFNRKRSIEELGDDWTPSTSHPTPREMKKQKGT